MEENFESALKTMNFKLEPDESRKMINKWVEEKTRDKIKVFVILSPFVPVDLEFLASYWPMTGVCTLPSKRNATLGLGASLTPIWGQKFVNRGSFPDFEP